MKSSRRWLLVPLFWLVCSPVLGAPRIVRSVIGGGGGRVAGANHTLLSVAGQPAVGQVSGSHLLQAGYFFLPGTGLVPVHLVWFRAERSGSKVILRWQIASPGGGGFHVWRRVETGPRLRLDQDLVQGSVRFSFVDPAPPAGELAYWLQEVVPGGQTTWFGPAPVSALALTCALEPARPNPFNPRTTLTCSLPASGTLRLVIYDLRGRKVRCLVDEVRPAGRYRATWDGRDDLGAAVASGTYFAALETTTGRRYRKLVLAR